MQFYQNHTFQATSYPLPIANIMTASSPNTIPTVSDTQVSNHVLPTTIQNGNVGSLPPTDVLRAELILPQVPFSSTFDPSMICMYQMKHMEHSSKEDISFIDDNSVGFSSNSLCSLAKLADLPASGQEFIDIPYVEPLTSEHLYTIA